MHRAPPPTGRHRGWGALPATPRERPLSKRAPQQASPPTPARLWQSDGGGGEEEGGRPRGSGPPGGRSLGGGGSSTVWGTSRPPSPLAAPLPPPSVLLYRHIPGGGVGGARGRRRGGAKRVPAGAPSPAALSPFMETRRFGRFAASLVAGSPLAVPLLPSLTSYFGQFATVNFAKNPSHPGLGRFAVPSTWGGA